MKLKEGYLLRQVAGEGIVIPVGRDIDHDKAYGMNETALFILEQLQEGMSEDDILYTLMNVYDVDRAQGKAAIDKVIERSRELNMME